MTRDLEQSANGAAREVRAPADGDVVGTLRLSTLDDVGAAVDAARDAARHWGRVAPHQRASVLTRAAQAIEENADALATLHSRESGKVIAQARKEVHGAAFILKENAHVARFDSGYLAPTGALSGGETDMTVVERVPLGVVVCVIPFNFPVELTIEKAGAALAAGNAAVVKPPPQNPLATVETVRILNKAGLPPGVLSVVAGDTEISAALCAAEGVDAVSLTGSVGAGIAVARSTAHLLRPLHLELGGNGASVVLDDADLDQVVSETIKGRTLMNGQACAATKRLVVHSSVLDDLTERLRSAIGQLRVGEPTDPSSDVGPLIDVRSAERVAAQVGNALDQGGQLLAGSGNHDDAWFAPTLIGSLPPEADVARDDEIFGPVVSMIPFDSDSQAADIVNASQLALTAAVFSADLPRAMAVAQSLNVGGIVINGTNNYRPPVVPFGGVGLAGTGREGIGYTYEELTRTRFIAIKGLRPAGVALQKEPDD